MGERFTARVMELKQKLQLLMARRNLNGQRLARLSGVSDSEISRILQGKSRPGLDNAMKLARAVGVSLDYLANESLEDEPTAPEEALSADQRRILGLCEKLGLAEALAILENARFLGYEIAMSRLVGARPVIEVDREPLDSRDANPPRAAAGASA